MRGEAESGRSPGAATTVRFGAFQADLRQGKLRKHGIRIKLGGQPFQVLASLLERPGELVSRDELRQRLWQDDTFVEFDDGLNSAVKRLRDALGDSSRKAQYIRTIPKRGYQFVAPIEVIESEPTAPIPEEPEPAGVAEPGLDGTAPLNRVTRNVVITAGVVIALVTILWIREAANSRRHVEAGQLRFEARALPGFPPEAVLSPDGRSVAFTRRGEQPDIYIASIEGGQPTRVTNHPDAERSLSWSPDGLQIAFTRLGKALGTYMLSLRDGSEILVGHHSSHRLSWTPDGKSLIGSYARVFALSLETREQSDLLPEDTNLHYGAVAVSPDGTSLAVSVCQRPSITSCDVYVRPMEGGEPRRLTFQNGDISALAWTPDSREIIYDLDGRMYRIPTAGVTQPSPLEFSYPDSVTGRVRSPSVAGSRMTFVRYTRDTDIWATDVSQEPGSPHSSRKLIDSPGIDRSPRYSPDGGHIAFYSDRPGGDRALWVANSDGSNPRQLTPSTFRVSDNWDAGPAWSPDGLQIAFRASTTLDPRFSIYTTPLNGGYPKRITKGGNVRQPLWSRNGLHVFHRGSYTFPTEVGRVRSDGLAPNEPFNETLSWCFAESLDGEYLYFCGNSGRGTGYGSLWRMRVEDKVKEEVRRRFSFSAVELREEGMYFLDRGDLKLLNLQTGQVTEFARLKRPLGSFSISPDRQSVLTAIPEGGHAELMLVEDFR